MLRRIVRPALIVLCILAGVGAATFTVLSHQHSSAARAAASEAATRVDGIVADLGELDAALQAYTVPGQSLTTWAPRAAGLHARLAEEATGLSALPDAAPSVEALRAALTSLAKIDSRVREYLRSGDDLMAADLAFNEARGATASAVLALRDWRTAQVSAAQAAEQQAAAQLPLGFGALALAWVVSLVVALRRSATEPVAAPGAALAADLSDVPMMTSVQVAVSAPSSLNLPGVAEACTGLASARDAVALKAALGRGASALDAKGLVVWLGVGDQLFAVASHGYDERHLSRPIARDAQNVTAEAWRTAQGMAIAGEADAPGVIVVPMAGPAGCRGVVSAELRAGIEAGVDRQALLTVLAAQLGGLVAAPATAAPAAQPTPAVEQAS